MAFFSYALGAILLILVLLRQIRAVPVPRLFQPRLPVIVGVIGLFAMSSYAGDNHVSAAAWGWVIGTIVVGAIGLGALRGLSMRVWASNGWVLRQGTAVTIGLWLLSLLVHFAVDAAGNHAGAAGLEGASFLLYLGVTLAVQYYVVHRRALPLWAQLGPDAGRRMQVTFTQVPADMFTFFRTGAGQPGPGGQGGMRDDDPNIIDAEVVDDEDDRHDGPPELHAPG
jgi:hypothetical protein